MRSSTGSTSTRSYNSIKRSTRNLVAGRASRPLVKAGADAAGAWFTAEHRRRRRATRRSGCCSLGERLLHGRVHRAPCITRSGASRRCRPHCRRSGRTTLDVLGQRRRPARLCQQRTHFGDFGAHARATRARSSPPPGSAAAGPTASGASVASDVINTKRSSSPSGARASSHSGVPWSVTIASSGAPISPPPHAFPVRATRRPRLEHFWPVTTTGPSSPRAR